ncbi:MAG: B12-binding domain-containing radical SAM protein, partial [Salibacteraceae bacterium]
VTLRLFSKDGFTQIFDTISHHEIELSENCQRIVALAHEYIDCIDAVISFLQGNNPTLAHSIVTRSYLPECSRFSHLEDLDWAFGELGIHDKAKHLATLYLEDMADLIVEAIDPDFGFSRYAEKIAVAASSFDEIHEHVEAEPHFIDELIIEELEKNLALFHPKMVAISIPFPGNLYGALKVGQYIKQNHPSITIAMGGGYPNTELRSLKDARVFRYTHYITLDDGEAPLSILLEHLKGNRNQKSLKRTLTLVDDEVHYINGAPEPDFNHWEVGTPDYTGLSLNKYISVIEIANPMHRLWSDGRWNKLTLAHGCYWGKCTFCDVSLDYIKRYQPITAEHLCNQIETIIAQTGETGFHFVDEAAPPALLRDLSIEILRRGLKISWWTNIRFEKSFSSGLTQLMQKAGCIAVSGGLEVASDRLLKLIKKGVSLEKVSKVTHNFTQAGIMVHAYLMYGFPTQTDQETIDSLEVVRQLFEVGIIQSAYWHQFSMTAHSPIGMNPDTFKVSKLNPELGKFANNDLIHEDPTGADHSKYSEGLKKSLFNYMHGIGFDFNHSEWFDFKTPKTTHKKDKIASYIKNQEFQDSTLIKSILWTGSQLIKSHKINKKNQKLTLYSANKTLVFELPEEQSKWVKETLQEIHISNNKKTSYKELETSFNDQNLGYFLLFWNEPLMTELRKNGLLTL